METIGDIVDYNYVDDVVNPQQHNNYATTNRNSQQQNTYTTLNRNSDQHHSLLNKPVQISKVNLMIIIILIISTCIAVGVVHLYIEKQDLENRVNNLEEKLLQQGISLFTN